MSQADHSLSLSNPEPSVDWIQKIAIALGAVGLFLLLGALFGMQIEPKGLWLTTSLILMGGGTIIYALREYRNKPEGIKNNGVWFDSLTNRGILGWILGIAITGFYVFLYYFPEFLGLSESGNTGLVAFFDPLSQALKGQPASQWFVYGTLYTLAILVFGIKFILKYRHNIYHVVRTISIMFFQLGFAFLIPELLIRLNYPYNDFKQMWPLNYYFFDEWSIKGMIDSGGFGLFMLVFGVLMIFVISPILTYYFGKRWYCSWVCGCGGLAETAGDPFRHLSDKSLKAWRIERWVIHLVLVFAVIMTLAVLYSFFHNNPEGFLLNKTVFIGISSIVLVAVILFFGINNRYKKGVSTSVNRLAIGIAAVLLALVGWAFLTGQSNALFIDSYNLRSIYGFFIGAAFSGVIGVGFYPLLGSRVWCRFGCPMAAILGLQQRFFSRFRITTNGGQCISCGNCSTYCEMGIDVRQYAQKGQNIVRASCVGCGVCAAVCPRGVLRLENGKVDIDLRME